MALFSFRTRHKRCIASAVQPTGTECRNCDLLKLPLTRTVRFGGRKGDEELTRSILRSKKILVESGLRRRRVTVAKSMSIERYGLPHLHHDA
jgi:hypothetical protein